MEVRIGTFCAAPLLHRCGVLHIRLFSQGFVRAFYIVNGNRSHTFLFLLTRRTEVDTANKTFTQMKHYLVVGVLGELVTLEDLSLENREKKEKITVRKDCENTLWNEKKSAKILKRLPDNFKLSPFNDGDGRLVFDGKKILYDLTPAMVDFTDDMPIEMGSIIGVSDWK